MLRYRFLSASAAAMMLLGATATHAQTQYFYGDGTPVGGEEDIHADADVNADATTDTWMSTSIDGEDDAFGMMGTVDADAMAALQSNPLASQSLLDQFLRPQAVTGVSTNRANALTYADFDVRAFVNHPCFDIRGTNERAMCQKLFGRHANLRQALANGHLARLLQGDDRIQNADATLLLLTAAQAEADLAASLTATDDEDVFDREDAWMRSSMVWSRCGAMHGGSFDGAVSSDTDADVSHDHLDARSHSMAAANAADWRLMGACYQRALRLVHDNDVTVNNETLQILNEDEVGTYTNTNVRGDLDAGMSGVDMDPDADNTDY